MADSTNLTAPGPVETFGWAPTSSTGPTIITVAIATPDSGPSDEATGPPFSQSMPPEWLPLLHAAELEWEIGANIHFVDITDQSLGLANQPLLLAPPDILIGVAALTTDEKTADAAGFTHWKVDSTGHFLPGITIKLDDPTDGPVVQLADGDFEYVGFPTTVFQTMLHELGHAIGLAHNEDNPASIMNPVLSADNRILNAQDTDASRSLYGPASPTATLNFSKDDLKLLDSVVFNRSDLLTT